MNVKLLVVQGRPRGKTLHFPPGEYIVGRGPECHLRPNSDWVSRQHCLLRVTPEGILIRDLGSRNGTLVNGMRVVDERWLGDRDQIQVGPLVLEVQYESLLPKPAPTPAVPDQEETGMLFAETVDLPRLEDGPSKVEAPEPAPPEITSPNSPE